MIVTFPKTTIVKAKPNQIIYHDYKNYDDCIFKDDLTSNLNADAKNQYKFSKIPNNIS